MTQSFFSNFLLNNAQFISNITKIYPEGAAWLLNLPTQLTTLAERWEFKLKRVLPGLSYHFVALVERQNQSLILKVAPSEHNLKNEYLGLSCFQKNVPAIIHFDEKDNAILMEYIYPGDMLVKLVKNGQDDQATQIICELIQKLRFQSLPLEHSFKHLSDLANDLAILRGHFDEQLLNKAIRLFQELTLDRTNDILLHGDLHHYNILSSEKQWMIIDPHCYIGDPAAEVGAMIRNPYHSFPREKPLEKTIERRLSILQEELSYDYERIKAWCYCLSVLSIAWTFDEFHTIKKSDLDLIQVLNKV